MRRSKRYQQVEKLADRTKAYKLSEALETVKKTATAKFDESVDLALKLGVDPKHSDQMVRGTVSLPFGSGKKVRVAVFAKEADAKKAKEAGAEIVGFEDLVEKVTGGWADFDVAIATPDTMREVGKLGKVLGPKGLMPTPKTGTVTADVVKAIKEVKAGRIEFKIDKDANLHVAVGKASFDKDKLVENAKTVINAVLKAKPATAKGIYIQNCVVSSSMGPGLKVDLREFGLGGGNAA